MLTKTLFKERKPAPMGAHRVLPPLTLFIAVNAAPLPAIASHVQGGACPVLQTVGRARLARELMWEENLLQALG